MSDFQHQHGKGPFGTPEDRRDPIRRLRGSLPAPVTLWTAWASGRRPVGLTVSSVMVAEGDPALLLGLLGPLTDLFEAISDSGRFLVHQAGPNAVRLADELAGRFPVDPFDHRAWEHSDHGPLLTDCPTRARCALLSTSEAGWFSLVQARIEQVELDPGLPPMAHWKGAYAALSPR